MTTVISITLTVEELKLIIKEVVVSTYREFYPPLAKKKESEYLTRKQACQILNVSSSSLYNYVKAGKIKTHRIGNRVLIKRKDLDDSIIHAEY